jgi:hypothetical protein
VYVCVCFEVIIIVEGKKTGENISYSSISSSLLPNGIVFINFMPLKRTENIKKRGEECSFHSFSLYVLGYYGVPGNPGRSVTLKVGSCSTSVMAWARVVV